MNFLDNDYDEENLRVIDISDSSAKSYIPVHNPQNQETIFVKGLSDNFIPSSLTPSEIQGGFLTRIEPSNDVLTRVKVSGPFSKYSFSEQNESIQVGVVTHWNNNHENEFGVVTSRTQYNQRNYFEPTIVGSLDSYETDRLKERVLKLENELEQLKANQKLLPPPISFNPKTAVLIIDDETISFKTDSIQAQVLDYALNKSSSKDFFEIEEFWQFIDERHGKFPDKNDLKKVRKQLYQAVREINRKVGDELLEVSRYLVKIYR